jgi:hypothetical protein
MSNVNEMNLLALNIRVGQTTKHVGKVGVAPDGSHDAFCGKRILYKEVSSEDLFCRSTHTYSIDRYAMDYAVSLGAEYLVMWVTDSKVLLFIESSKVRDGHVVDLGERPQYRFHPTWCHISNGASAKRPLPMGWTKNEVNVDDAFGRLRGSELFEKKEAYSLFD